MMTLALPTGLDPDSIYIIDNSVRFPLIEFVSISTTTWSTRIWLALEPGRIHSPEWNSHNFELPVALATVGSTQFMGI